MIPRRWGKRSLPFCIKRVSPLMTSAPMISALRIFLMGWTYFFQNDCKGLTTRSRSDTFFDCFGLDFGDRCFFSSSDSECSRERDFALPDGEPGRSGVLVGSFCCWLEFDDERLVLVARFRSRAESSSCFISRRWRATTMARSWSSSRSEITYLIVQHQWSWWSKPPRWANPNFDEEQWIGSER